MGILRLLLALSVVLEHLGSSMQWIGGWRAVQVFYYISGFYMALILGQKYQNSRYSTFLGNRFLRLFPIYYLTLFLLVLRWVSSYLTHVPCEYYFPHCGQINWHQWGSLVFVVFTQLAILGQDWLFFLRLDSNGSFYFTKDGLTEAFQAYVYNINPVSWTLGLEITFYLIAPFLLKRSYRTLLILVFVSLAFRWVGYFKWGLNNLVWSYRFFPFELAVFLLGSLCYRCYRSYLVNYFENYSMVPTSLALVGILGTLFFVPMTKVVTHPTLVYYALIGLSIPALFHLTKKTSMDRRIGDLSYPIYLIHMPICSLGQRFVSSNPIYLILVVILCAFFINKWISQPIDRYREQRLS